jgi:hypothetical protein
MADRWVVNASPLILLGKAGILPLLPALCDELVVPAGIVTEVQHGRIADIGRAWLAADGARFVRPASPLHPLLANWNGGAGEADVISWALVSRNLSRCSTIKPRAGWRASMA